MYFWSQIPKLHKMDKQLYLNRTIEEVIELLPMTYTETESTMSQMALDDFLYSGLYPAVCAKKNKPHFFYPSYGSHQAPL